MTQGDEARSGMEAEHPKGKKGNRYGAVVAKKDKADKMRVLVFEPEGGSPYTVDVKPEKGRFQLPNSDQTFKIARGSVWIEDGVARTCVNAANPITVNIHTLTGADIFHPTTYNADVNNNLAEQVARIAKTKPVWARGTTWGLLASAIVLALLFLWMIKTVGAGFEDLQNAIEGIKVAAQEAGQSGSGGFGSGTEAQVAAGHNPIAPGGP